MHFIQRIGRNVRKIIMMTNFQKWMKMIEILLKIHALNQRPPLENQVCIQCWTIVGLHLNVVSLPDRWWPACIINWTPHQLKNQQRCLIWTPSEKTFWFRSWDSARQKNGLISSEGIFEVFSVAVGNWHPTVYSKSMEPEISHWVICRST